MPYSKYRGNAICDREGNGTPLQYSCLKNPMDGGAWWAAAHEVAKSWTQLSDFTFTFPFHALEKAMATHSSVLAWRIPGTEEPGRRPSMGLHRVGHDWSDLAAAAPADCRFLWSGAWLGALKDLMIYLKKTKRWKETVIIQCDPCYTGAVEHFAEGYKKNKQPI